MRKYQFLSAVILGAVFGSTLSPLVVHLFAYMGVHPGHAVEFGVAMLAAALVGLLFWAVPGNYWRKRDVI
jgi:hypothetical protein